MNPINTEEKKFRAYHLAQRLVLSSVSKAIPDKPYRISATEIVYRPKMLQFVIIYKFGSIVFFNTDQEYEKKILEIMQPFIQHKTHFFPIENFSLQEGSKSKVEFRRVIVTKITFERIQIISLALAQSTALEYFETLIANLMEKSGIISQALEHRGKIGKSGKSLVQFIGFCLNIKQEIIASTSILDSPDTTWESQTLEQLYRQMSYMFELRDRFRTLEYKLKTIQETVEILSDLSRARSTLYLEIAVVALIAVEIVLFVYEMISK